MRSKIRKRSKSKIKSKSRTHQLCLTLNLAPALNLLLNLNLTLAPLQWRPPNEADLPESAKRIEDLDPGLLEIANVSGHQDQVMCESSCGDHGIKDRQ